MSPLPSHIRKLAMQTLDPEYTRVPATALVEALSHKGVGIITLAQNHPDLTEEELRSAFARTAELLEALELELSTAPKGKSADSKTKRPNTYKGFPTAELEPFIHPNVDGKFIAAYGYVDGCCQSNPGPAGIGGVLCSSNGEQIARISKAIGIGTNNIAEYSAFITLLQVSCDLGVKNLNVFSDSELMVKQVNGEYKVRNEKLLPLMLQVNSLLKRFDSFKLTHVPREQNKLADALSTWCIDREKYSE